MVAKHKYDLCPVLSYTSTNFESSQLNQEDRLTFAWIGNRSDEIMNLFYRFE